MEIKLQLDDEYVRKLAYIQEQTEQELIEAIQSAIAYRYEQLQQQSQSSREEGAIWVDFGFGFSSVSSLAQRLVTFSID